MKNKKFAGPWRLDEGKPWLTEGSIQFFKDNVLDTDNILEFGSGASTIFFAKHTKGKIISFESGGYSVRKGNLKRSMDWYERLTEKIRKDNIKNIELYLLQGYPASSIVYSHVIDSLPNNFSWILVDGANRNLCIDKGRSKLRDGGYMIVDNYDHIPEERMITNMELYMKNEYCSEIIYELLDGWDHLKFDAEDWPGKGTIIFQKPWRE